MCSSKASTKPSVSLILLHFAKNLHPPNQEHPKSSYAGVHDKSHPKAPTPKHPSVMTVPSKSTDTVATCHELEPLKSQKTEPKTVEINDKSDDTIENIPSVKTKEGVSYESDGQTEKSPAEKKKDDIAMKLLEDKKINSQICLCSAGNGFMEKGPKKENMVVEIAVRVCIKKTGAIGRVRKTTNVFKRQQLKKQPRVAFENDENNADTGRNGENIVVQIVDQEEMMRDQMAILGPERPTGNKFF
ncbi:hypothetical protein GCK72_013185 [Caenorhabditis remanei]|uniref:Uncharacterized protein n=1 Tax=Caenorhabditis remanei TaxID=31234 RepID=A0A6A5GPX3_CAERE|nr:hypothetical protein GCK72_013185 [Caenorhabditis remanei]KAF1756731.1 hypothetical protein GCK72_013185 [Caenorhabditis remanei]